VSYQNSINMKFTNYFNTSVLLKRPYLKIEWCERAKTEFIYKEIEENKRIRYWIYISEFDKYLRVVYLEDNETIHNAFFDRDFLKNHNL